MKNKHTHRISVKTPIGLLSFSTESKEGILDGLEIISSNIDPELKGDYKIEGCVAILLRCISQTPIRDFVFTCRWEGLRDTGYPASGQYLDAWQWESKGNLVIIGTEDWESLNLRLKLKKDGNNDDYPITMVNNVINIIIDEFDANQVLSLHYVVAWNKSPEPVDCSCWYAVDISHKKIREIFNKN